MTLEFKEDELKPMSVRPKLTTEQILNGPHVTARERIQLYSDKEFEVFIQDWLQACLSDKYTKIKRCGGAGDLGRDVIAYISDGGKWDNYQCKHYDKKLQPTDVYLELGKHIYYSYMGRFKPSESYYFVSPRGIGPKLNDLLDNVKNLKKELVNSWDSYCLKKITSSAEVKLDGSFKDYLEKFDFSIFKEYQIETIIEEFSVTKYYPSRFGGGLNTTRENIPKPPDKIDSTEFSYVAKLFEVYGEKLNQVITSKNDLNKFKNELSHFERQRVAYYSAESLKEFSRDNLHSQLDYNSLLQEFYTMIVNVVDSNFSTGWDRLCKAIEVSGSIVIDKHPLKSEMDQQDRNGICHQLANEKDDIKWKE